MSLWSHAQTVTAAFPLTRRPARDVRVEELELAIDAADPSAGALVVVAEWQPRTAPAVIVLHGVGGSSDDPYVVRAGRALGAAGFHVLRVNQRGSGLGIGRAPLLYHAGMSDDVRVVRALLEPRDDVDDVFVIGFSLGGHVALSHAADVGAGPRGKLRAVASVSAPIDLAETMRRFDADRRKPAVFYERLMVRSLVEKARALLQRGPQRFDAHDLEGIVDIRTFDHLVTCRCHGFADVADYHARAGVVHRFTRIEVPTLAIHAEDDPIVPCAPLLRAARSSAVEVVALPRGGHVGFVDSAAQLFGATAAVARAIAHFQRHSGRPAAQT